LKLPDTISIRPLTVPVNAAVTVPGSKSITNRLLILSALAHGRSILHGALWSQDTEVMVDCLRKLGFEVDVHPEESHPCNRRIEVEGRGGEIPGAGTSARPLELFTADSGTAARFLTALVCLRRGFFRIDGTPRMRQRPMADLVGILRELGVTIRSENGDDCLPILIDSPGLQGGQVEISGERSSQFASALMLVSGCIRVNLVLRITGKRVSEPFLDLTSALMMQALGKGGGLSPVLKTSTSNECRFEIPSIGYRAREWLVEPDASAASYLMAMAAILGGSIRVPRLTASALQGDIRFWVILREYCGRCVLPMPGEECSLTGPWRWMEERSLYFAPISDTFMTMAVIAPFGQAALTMNGLGHTRHQESDRLAVMATELARTGVRAERIGEDALRIHPCQSWQEATIRTCGDHRIAMAFAVLGMRDVKGGGKPWLRIEHPSCVAKTYPNFFEAMEDVARQSYAAAKQPPVPTVLGSDGKPLFR
jgi:3-phosphoshikimate 1-carboxyvinyltransferase